MNKDQPDMFPDCHTPLEPNPMARKLGRMEGKKCKTCKHLFYRQMANKYYKCAYRGDTRGKGTDHRVNWNACIKWEIDNV